MRVIRYAVLAASVLITAALLLLIYGVRQARDAAPLPVLFRIPEFTLMDQDGHPFSHSELQGKVWVVNFIFTRCPGPCPLMTDRMKSLQVFLQSRNRIEAVPPLRFVSISVDPAYDTPEILRRYALARGADLTSWTFLTGPPEATLALIRNGFLIGAQHDPEAGSGVPSKDSVIHGTQFLLVDPEGQVRAIHDYAESGLVEILSEQIESLRVLRVRAKITSHFRIPSWGHPGPIFTLKILSVGPATPAVLLPQIGPI